MILTRWWGARWTERSLQRLQIGPLNIAAWMSTQDRVELSIYLFVCGRTFTWFDSSKGRS